MYDVMPPHLVVCPFCERLFSRFSIGLHQPQCKQNPYKMTVHKDLSSKSKSKKPSGKKRSKSVGHNAKSFQKAKLDDRPSTTTFTSKTKKPQDLPTPTTSSLPQTCFVCGQNVDYEPLIDHEIECEAVWRTNRRDLPAYMQVRSPKKMRIPSVDGTIDGARLDWYAEKSATAANRVRCLKCGRVERFDDACGHQCARFEPTVQFYF
ncbi:unnamed protein product [Bursaphelenchus okinawaensis]|uniref:Uncharacterized protein n=1 Tax=Bursaphelenchus okinawaensis TaxID=465554 RepID=A0A811LT91_9BILA|nr:unnamed protein product [Bursaphelenchus okinawaensis]CAG9128166.1 unnamed protein product [Bursaphelenchus okinawaensis]